LAPKRIRNYARIVGKHFRLKNINRQKFVIYYAPLTFPSSSNCHNILLQLKVCLTKSMLFNGGRLMSLNSPVGQEHSSLYCLFNDLLRLLKEFSLYWRTLFQHNKSHLSRIMFSFQLCCRTTITV